MTKRTRLIIAGVGLVAAAASSLVRESHWPWSRDSGVGLSVRYKTAHVVDLTKDAGPLTCWLRLRLPAGARPRVLLDDTQLQVFPDGQWWKVTNPEPVNVAGPPPFKWYPGGHVYVHSAHSRLEGWELYRDDGPADSSAKERRRGIAFAFSLVCVAITTMAGFFAVVYQDPPQPARYLPDNCVYAIIDTLIADPREKTQRMQELLVRTIRKKKYAALNVAPSERVLFIQGKRKLAVEIEDLIERLTDDLSKLR